MPETRLLWMMRSISDRQSFLFAVPVLVSEDEPGVFSACVIGMEQQMAATGGSADNAVDNARLLFMATIDDALIRQTSIAFATSVQPLTLNVPFKDADRVFQILATMDLDETDKTDHWLRIPPHIAAAHQHVE